MSFVDEFAVWYINLSPTAVTMIAFGIFVVLCILAIAIMDYVDPLKVEQRAIRRKRKQRRIALRVLNRASGHTDRNCFREYRKS